MKLYDRIILTIISILLLLHLLVRIFPIQPVKAGSGVQDVNVSHIAGRELYNKILEVKVVE